MTRVVTVAATQMRCSWDIDDNIRRAEGLVRAAHAKGAQIILLQELFGTPYFCIDQDLSHLTLAQPADDSRLIQHFQALAAELHVVLPLSFFEKANRAYFNSLAMIDADGAILGVYRKTHIPNDNGYQEKQFFTPGDTGFQVWDTAFARIGVGICWDQWFPETQRSLSLLGAELIFHPTAIGSEPGVATYDSQPHWTRVQQGAAGANLTPVIVSNRIGTETSKTASNLSLTFYGSAFIADQTGALVAQGDRVTEGVQVHSFDLDAIAVQRDWWGVFRDRRPGMYRTLLTSDGVHAVDGGI
ncbi:N-carbamoylputrescine amidase (plasmid) [Lichenicola cladoniae]|uniref:N-carbamoylputrescine amidase n=1 Tax=Lichenicola cladoniae TaxID=1484109 RepID=A0A6M8HZG8_9PROT|nr:N-carbamoylputrescine amidase [Lichenicola cladoniae]NPD70196.1 N-carbamoylputrescine amidase [Acetobacteraceae bacterium]QKE93481.1 N-carbamoylputrescine amidase [Lichenicola cladoniae]